MKIIFAGTPEFAVAPLKALLTSEHQIVAVYTQPDRSAGRGQKLTASPVKQFALAHSIPICQPNTLRDSAAQKMLADWHADIMIVVAYGLILPAAVLALPKYGCINIHASLLPRWRGAAPIQRAILAGDTESGITIMQMDEGLDTGDMLYQIPCPIYLTDTSQNLHDRLAQLGADILLKVLETITTDKIQTKIQDNNLACYAAKIQKAEAELNWQQNAERLDRIIRAFNPWPVAYTYCGEQLIRIWQTKIPPLKKGGRGDFQKNELSPGTIIHTHKNGIDVATGNGILRLLQIQLPGKKPLPVSDILNAHAELFSPGIKLGK